MRVFRLLVATRSLLPRVVPLMRDGRVPGWLKAAAVCAAIVIVSPLDPFSDIPILGLFDDAALLLLLVNLFVSLAERASMRTADVRTGSARVVQAIALPRAR